MQYFVKENIENSDLNISSSFIQSNFWMRWKQTLGRSIKSYYVIDNNDNVVCRFNALFLKIPVFNKPYVYVEYGPVWNVDAIDNDVFTNVISNYFKSFSFIALEQEDEIYTSKYKTKLRHQPPNTWITDLTLGMDELMKFSHKKTRYNVKIAEKKGVVIKSGFDEAALDLLTQTSERQKFNSYTLDYYKKLLNFDDTKVKQWTAYIDEKQIATVVNVYHDKTCTYLFGGSDYEHRNTMAPYKLHYKIMSEAINSGFEKYDWWGLADINGHVSGYARFKQNWHGNPKNYPDVNVIINESIWYNIYVYLKKIKQFLKK